LELLNAVIVVCQRIYVIVAVLLELREFGVFRRKTTYVPQNFTFRTSVTCRLPVSGEVQNEVYGATRNLEASA
jgi:hypothetical protein